MVVVIGGGGGWRSGEIHLTERKTITALLLNNSPNRLKLENVFMKHYAPNHMPDPKGEWTLKENNSELHHGIYSKVNQLIYT